ncbi:histidine kinase [Variovorax sp. RO1]|uniref:CHASE2 domain-containing protein n=1 Tax=Variovorax sp. RO1 TaxID=2066034 RepID=UPI000C71641C|nr:CHASE2 domain-containing protein [Variovorax sp. RO1]PLC01442.1 histidine kinase [Variovorax sp. RO1]
MRLLIERLLMALLLPLAMLGLAQRPGLLQMDAYIHDRLLILASHRASPDILIIAIDEHSLRELGRWPWSRETHARLLEGLAPAAPRGVLLDLFLTEPSADPREDARLAQAMGLLPVYLPLLHASPLAFTSHEWPGFLPPLPDFAAQARGVGHAGLAPDTDGVARTLYLLEGYPAHLQPYVGTLMAQRIPQPAPAPEATSTDWLRQSPLRLLFAGPRGSYRTVPYVSVLRGEVPAELLRDKLLLVGATAPGLGDQTLTPNASIRGVLPGVEVHANAIDNLMHGRNVSVSPPLWHAAWTVVPLWIALWLLVRRGRYALPIAVGLASTCLLISGIAMLACHYWLPPVAPMLGLAILYLLWSWRRLESQFVYLRRRAQVLDALPGGTFEVMPVRAPAPADPTEHPKQALDRAIARLRRMQQLMDKAMQAMPVAMLICDEEGRIGSGNAAAFRLLSSGTLPSHGDDDAPAVLRGVLLPELIAPLAVPPANGAPPRTDATHWTDLLHGEYVTSDARVFRLEAAAFSGDAPEDRGWVVMLPELTAEREAQRQRDEWRQFLSHDLRSPQVTILSILSMHEATADAGLRTAIRREAERTLALAEGFMDFALAESDDYRFADTHIGAVLLDAKDQVWHYAQTHGVRVEARLDDDAGDTILRADGALLTRAIVNLLNNAIRHSPSGRSVELRMSLEPGTGSAGAARVRISVGDQGSGMTSDQLDALIHAPRGRRVPATPEAAPSETKSAGTRRMGLGFSVVRAVVQKHHGTLGASSTPGVGTTVWLLLPLTDSRPITST